MTEPLLHVDGLYKAFGALQATDGVTLTLMPGEIHALIGPNGAGKSTLIKQIAGGVTPDAGRVWFKGQDVTALSTQARAQAGLGRTFQISSLAMEATVLQNAVLGALGRAGSVWRFLRPVMRDAALVAQAQAALALKPHAFVMDEPMAGLGASGSKRMTTFLDGLRREAPILLVEHDMDAVFALADRISVLVYGKIIATGTADEIRADPLVRTAYLGEEDVA